jgi:hypothetical protein
MMDCCERSGVFLWEMRLTFVIFYICIGNMTTILPYGTFLLDASETRNMFSIWNQPVDFNSVSQKRIRSMFNDVMNWQGFQGNDCALVCYYVPWTRPWGKPRTYTWNSSWFLWQDSNRAPREWKSETLRLELTSQMERWVKSPGGHLVLYSAAIFVRWGTFVCFENVLGSKNKAAWSSFNPTTIKY